MNPGKNSPDALAAVAARFAEHFEHWKFTLPARDVADRRAGCITGRGWLVQYAFGRDETGEYPDYYASHRMTEDSHCRLHADGREEALPAMSGMHLTSDDSDEAGRLAEENARYNREVAAMLEAKGFGRFGINQVLWMGWDQRVERP